VRNRLKSDDYKVEEEKQNGKYKYDIERTLPVQNWFEDMLPKMFSCDVFKPEMSCAK